MAKRCGRGKSRCKVLQQTDERALETNKSAKFNWNLTLQGKVWKPDEVNGSNKGLCWPPWGQQPRGLLGPRGAKATQPSCRQWSHTCRGRACSQPCPHPQPMSPQAIGRGGHKDAHLTRHRGPQGSSLPELPPGPLRSLLVAGAAQMIQIPHLSLNISPLHSSKSNKKPWLKQIFYRWKGSIAREYEPL